MNSGDLKGELLAPLIPRAATGRPRLEDRQVINGTVCKTRTGISWRDLPERHGFWQTVHTRFRHYAIDGVFIGALQQTQVRANAAGGQRTTNGPAARSRCGAGWRAGSRGGRGLGRSGCLVRRGR
ncbi:transposase [Streptomyces sp. NPDC057236]|uniref:transposase n=1 Tax=Streptomyces sp. NPDC057236 TaxID=3346059 RepID=UPI0036447B6E